MAHESKSKYKEIYLGEQKNVGVNSMEFTALNKGETVGKGLGLVCRTKTSQSEVKGTATQNKTDREGLELVRGTKESQAEVKRNRGAKQNSAGEGLELVPGTEGSQSEGKGNRGAKQNKPTGEGLELVNQKTGNRGARQHKPSGEGLELVLVTEGSQSVVASRKTPPGILKQSGSKRTGTSHLNTEVYTHNNSRSPRIKRYIEVLVKKKG